MYTFWDLTGDGWTAPRPDAGKPVERWQVNVELYGEARLIQWACVYASESATMDVRRELHNRFGGPPVLAEGSAIQGLDEL